MPPVDELFQRHERHLWGLCYRMTGSAADADDLVQETFLRVLERPPDDLERELRPWLVRVGTNLAIDHLRRRKRRPYVGPWLPAPVVTEGEDASPIEWFDDEPTADRRYDLLESVTSAFLLALEVLTPRQRAVLLLRDVFEHTVAETAEALSTTEGSVKTTHHRARRALATYDTARRRPTPELRQRILTTLSRTAAALAAGRFADFEALLAPDAVLATDSAGTYHAARKVLFGPERVAKFLRGILGRRRAQTSGRIAIVNGLPALVVEFSEGRSGDPPRAVVRVELDDEDRLVRLETIVAPEKLKAIRFGVDSPTV